MVPHDSLAILGNVELHDAIYKKHTAHSSVGSGKRRSSDEHWGGRTLKRPDVRHWRLANELLPMHSSIVLDIKAIGRWAKPANAFLLSLDPEFGHFIEDEPIQPVGLPSHGCAL